MLGENVEASTERIEFLLLEEEGNLRKNSLGERVQRTVDIMNQEGRLLKISQRQLFYAPFIYGTVMDDSKCFYTVNDYWFEITSLLRSETYGLSTLLCMRSFSSLFLRDSVIMRFVLVADEMAFGMCLCLEILLTSGINLYF